jgi:hypothetical protein
LKNPIWGEKCPEYGHYLLKKSYLYRGNSNLNSREWKNKERKNEVFNFMRQSAELSGVWSGVCLDATGTLVELGI